MVKHQINLGIQVVPITTANLGYPVIDKCIELIQSSGITNMVTSFETVLEGDYYEIMTLVTKINELANTHTNELVVNFRIHTKQSADVRMGDKINKHNSNN